MQKSFSKRLSRQILLLVSILFTIVLLVVAIYSHNIIADEATRSVENIRKAAIAEIEIPLNTVKITTQTTADIVATQLGNEEVMKGIVYEMVRRNRLICGCAIALPKDNNGNLKSIYGYRDSIDSSLVHIKSLNENGYDYTSEEWFSCAMTGKKPCWSNPYFDANGGGVNMTTYSVPLLDADSNVVAVVTSDLPLDWMDAKVSAIKPYKSAISTVLCPNGAVIGLGDTNLLMAGRIMAEENDQVKEIVEQMRKGNDTMIKFMNGSSACFAVFAPLSNGWSLSIVCSYYEVLARSSQMHLILIIIGLITLLVLFIICYRTIKRLTRPITELSVSALNMAKGNFNATLPEISSHDEMQQLRDAFAYMQTSLCNYISELKTTAAANNRMEGELTVARDIQLGMLSRDFPPQMYALLEPAKEVGGDLYDFHLKGNYLYFSVGDVSGKGAPAALLMAITQASLHFVSNRGMRLQDVMASVNHSICDANSNDMFVTLFIGRLDLATGELAYCNAGHNPIIIAPAQDEAYYLKAKPNLALGIFPDFAYEDEHMQLDGDAHLLLYTDGVTEAEQKDHSQYGDDRLLAFANNQALRDSGVSARQIAEQLYASVKQFTGDIPQNDDITILSIQYNKTV